MRIIFCPSGVFLERNAMVSERLQAFSDGVIAILITIMVLELKPPALTTPAALVELFPVFVSYLMSFLYIGIYWNHHHQLFVISKNIDGKVLWANLNFLFWLSLIPFTTAWIGDNHIDDIPVLLYGIVFLLSEISFLILKKSVANLHPKPKTIHFEMHKSKTNTLFFVIHITGLLLMFVNDYIPLIFFVMAWGVKVFSLRHPSTGA